MYIHFLFFYSFYVSELFKIIRELFEANTSSKQEVNTTLQLLNLQTDGYEKPISIRFPPNIRFLRLAHQIDENIYSSQIYPEVHQIQPAGVNIQALALKLFEWDDSITRFQNKDICRQFVLPFFSYFTTNKIGYFFLRYWIWNCTEIVGRIFRVPLLKLTPFQTSSH